MPSARIGYLEEMTRVARKAVEVDPQLALVQARKAAEEVLRIAIEAKGSGDRSGLDKAALEELLNRARSESLVPEIQMVHVRAIQAYGNPAVHGRFGAATVTSQDVEPAVGALVRLVHWLATEIAPGQATQPGPGGDAKPVWSAPPPRQFSILQRHVQTIAIDASTVNEMGWSQAEREIGRVVHKALIAALVDVARAGVSPDILYLLTLTHGDASDADVEFAAELVSHVTPFVHAFASRLTRLIESGTPGSDVPDIRVRLSYAWERLAPYRATMDGPAAATIAPIPDVPCRVRFPLRTSDVLRVMSAMARGKVVEQEGMENVTERDVDFLRWVQRVSAGKTFTWSDLSVNPRDPEDWSISPSAA